MTRVSDEILAAAQVAARLCPEKVRCCWGSLLAPGAVAKLGTGRRLFIVIERHWRSKRVGHMEFYPHEWQ